MTNLTPELIAKAKAAKSAEALLELAKANSVELTETEAKICFEQLHANGAVSDDELEAVAGGGAICDFFEDFFRPRNGRKDGSCPYCADELNPSTTPVKPAYDSNLTPLPYESFPGDSNDKSKIVFL